MRQTGAVLGFLSGLAIVAWIGFGGPKPPAPALPVSTANCSSADHQMSNMTSPGQEEAPEYFYLYRISYAWTSTIGFMITVLVGIIAGGFIGIRNRNVMMCVSGEVVRLIPVCWPEDDVHPSLLASCVRPGSGSSGELRRQFRGSEDLRMENKAVCYN